MLLIEALAKRKNIAFLGKMCTGKTTNALLLERCFGYTIINFADEVKHLASLVIEGPLEKSIHRGLIQDIGQIMKKPIISLTEEEHIKLKQWLSVGKFYDRYKYLSEIVDSIHTPAFFADVLINSDEYKHASAKGAVAVADMRFKAEEIIKEDFLIVKLEVPEDIRLQRLTNLYGKMDIATLTNSSELEVDKTFYHVCMKEPLFI